MSRLLKRIHGTGTAGAWTDGDDFEMTLGFIPLRDDLDLLMGACVQRNVWLGGSEVEGVVVTGTGDLTLLNWMPWWVDNASSQLSGFTDSNGASFVMQVRFFLRVSSASINVTPKLWYGSSMSAITTAATLSGTAACSATDEDYSGANQIQTVTVTMPSGSRYWKAGFTVAGSPGSPDQAWGRAFGDVFVSLP